MLWSVHGDGRRVRDGETVAPNERLTWPLMIGFGVQHVATMFGLTVLVPVAVGLPVSTVLLFSGVGTLLFLLLTRNRIPAYVGSSLAFVVPLAAVARQQGVHALLGGVLAAGLVLVVVGVAVKALGVRLLDSVVPPVVAGGLVLLVGLGAAPTATEPFGQQPMVATITTGTILLCLVFSRGLLARLAVLLGALAGWVAGLLSGAVTQRQLDAVRTADWVGLPELNAPVVQPSVVPLVVPVVIILVAETIAQVKAVALATGRNLDGSIGDALIANGLSTTLAGAGGGAGSTTYPQNMGLMVATRVYSTAACALAGLLVTVLAFCPKVVAVINTMPLGVMGGLMLPLFGLVAMIGVRIWLDNRVELTDPITLIVAGLALVAGLGGLEAAVFGIQMHGIAWGALLIVLLHPALRRLRGLRRG